MKTEITDPQLVVRRPLQSRDTQWAHSIARALARAGIQPNQVSIASAVFALGAGACLAFARFRPAADRSTLFILAALGIQLRLLCNLFDGMLAVEHGMKSRSGEIYNDFPDRIADLFILVGAGYSMPSPSWAADLGWLAGALAVLTAYVRVLGTSAGSQAYFSGPMAKQHRMALMTAACLLSALASAAALDVPILLYTLALIAAGSLATVIRRARQIIRELEDR